MSFLFSIPTPLKDLGGGYVLKDLISCGTWKHPTKHWTLEVDKATMKKWALALDAMRDGGIESPVYKDHKPSAENTLGYLKDWFRGGDAKAFERHPSMLALAKEDQPTDPNILYGVLHFPDDESLATAKRVGKVSVYLDDVIGGDGTKFGETIRHVAVTPEPIVSGQKGFIPIAASMGEVYEMGSDNSGRWTAAEDASAKATQATNAAERDKSSKPNFSHTPHVLEGQLSHQRFTAAQAHAEVLFAKAHQEKGNTFDRDKLLGASIEHHEHAVVGHRLFDAPGHTKAAELHLKAIDAIKELQSSVSTKSLSQGENDMAKFTDDELKKIRELLGEESIDEGNALSALCMAISKGPKAASLDADVLDGLVETAEARIDTLVTRNKINPAVADGLKKLFIGEGNSRNVYALSRNVSNTPESMVKSLCKILDQNDIVKLGEQTKGQALSRIVPGEEGQVKDEDQKKVTDEMAGLVGL